MPMFICVLRYVGSTLDGFASTIPNRRIKLLMLLVQELHEPAEAGKLEFILHLRTVSVHMNTAFEAAKFHPPLNIVDY